MGDKFDYGFDGSFDAIEENEYDDAGTIRTDYIMAGFPDEIQLKCSPDWTVDGDHIVWTIKTRAYNKLARRSTDAVPALLILMCLSGAEEDWGAASSKMLFLLFD